LEAWVKEERITDIKQKLKGNVEEDLARIAEMQWLMKNKGPFTYSVDANESYTFDQLGNFLESLRERGLQFPVFIEQPVSREEINSIPKEIKTFGIPIVADESVPTVDTAIEALDRGYGLALKSTAKGLTTSTLQLVEAKKRRAYRNSQDLTNMDLALRHHLSFASRVVRANQGVEANARQYIRPRDRDAAYSKFYEVRDGHVNL
jgi:L-alanine-DL-glutamate epimerase-like enolase superfamily enzyme